MKRKDGNTETKYKLFEWQSAEAQYLQQPGTEGGRRETQPPSLLLSTPTPCHCPSLPIMPGVWSCTLLGHLRIQQRWECDSCLVLEHTRKVPNLKPKSKESLNSFNQRLGIKVLVGRVLENVWNAAVKRVCSVARNKGDVTPWAWVSSTVQLAWPRPKDEVWDSLQPRAWRRASIVIDLLNHTLLPLLEAAFSSEQHQSMEEKNDRPKTKISANAVSDYWKF